MSSWSVATLKPSGTNETYASSSEMVDKIADPFPNYFALGLLLFLVRSTCVIFVHSTGS